VQADVRVLEHVQALGIRLHEPVLDPVVDHLHEVACAGLAAVEPALLLGGGSPSRPVCGPASTPGASASSTGARRSDRLVVAADHQAVAALQAPDTAADADVDVVDPAVPKLGLTAQVVDVVRVAAVDDRVALVEMRRELGDDRSTIPAGTISQTERGASSCDASSSSDEAVESTCGSKVLTLWPAASSRFVMFPPMRPRPTIPSCTRDPPI
jgi:hypothetical protein